MILSAYDNRPVRLTTDRGDAFEGVAELFPAGYGLHEFDREEESLRFGSWYVFESEIASVEPLDPARLCGFYGAEHVPEAIRELYRDLKKAWCAETCGPRLRPGWSPENPSLGQCSITAFLAQDLFGGTVRGIRLRDGSVHCFNEIGDDVFDLASEQFGGDEDLDYFDCPAQSRAEHFADADKFARYELLRRRLAEIRAKEDA